MRKINVLTVFAIVLLATTVLSAQATRTWVSGVGDDANPCSRTAPCKTFAGAISKTAPGGEIDALDPGGFGALTITKSITLDGGGGQVASVLVAGTNGIVVAGGSTDIVIIRNLRLDGLLGGGNANAGLSGIRFISGKALILENDVIFGFLNSGIDLEPNASASVTIFNTSVENIGSCAPASCLAGQGDGIFAKPGAGTLNLTINNTTVTVASNNCLESGTGTIAGVDHGSFTNCNNGVLTSGGFINIADSVIAYNTANGYNDVSGGIFVPSVNSATPVGTNKVHNNGATSSGTVTYQNMN